MATCLFALGTLALALYTYRLARHAREDVALTRQSIEAVDMPFVIPTPSPGDEHGIAFYRGGATDDEGPTGLQLRLWNLGQGPAVVTNVSLCVDDDEAMHPLPQNIPIGREQVHDARQPPASMFRDDAPNVFSAEWRDGLLTIF